MDIFVNVNRLLKFADDTKCYLHIHNVSNYYALQEDITALFTWSRQSDLDFNLDKFVHLSFKHKLETTYTASDTAIPHKNSHKDLGLENLSWEKHYTSISACAYKVLGLIRRTVAPTNSTSTLVTLHISVVRSQLLYCTQIWRPHLMKDILSLEQIQRCATKFLFNDYISNYKTCLVQLKILSLMYLLELQDIYLPLNLLRFQLNSLIYMIISISTLDLAPVIK